VTVALGGVLLSRAYERLKHEHFARQVRIDVGLSHMSPMTLRPVSSSISWEPHVERVWGATVLRKPGQVAKRPSAEGVSRAPFLIVPRPCRPGRLSY
jgi:hypothetical protein